jgi:ADP-ribose pyrophosphatase YjhB (NUDIX family)
MHRLTEEEKKCHGGHVNTTATLSSAMRRLFFEKTRHQFHQITRFVSAV